MRSDNFAPVDSPHGADADTYVEFNGSGSTRTGFAGIDASRFDTVRQIGRGGMGLVFEAIDRDSGQRVALKTLQSLTGQALYRFKREFRELVDLSHPCLVELYELHNVARDWFFTMELVDGRDLLDFVRADDANAPTRLERVERLLPQLLWGIDAIHRSGHLHMDVKPQNILIQRDGTPKILDFGLVRGLNEHRPSSATDQGVMGTVAYMAPEQAAGLDLGPPADYYALATVLFEAITGSLPFGVKPAQLLMAKQFEKAMAVTELVPEAAPALSDLIAALLDPDPEARPSTQEIFARAGVARENPSMSMRDSAEVFVEDHSFLGRSRELEELHDALTLARGGRHVSVLIEGPVGIGKTALLDEFARDLRRSQSGLVVLSGRCHQREVVRFNAFDGIVDALSHTLKRLPKPVLNALLPDDHVWATHLFPVLGRLEVAYVEGAQVPDPVQRQRRGLRAVYEIFARLAARAPPLVLLFDDLQWADKDSRALLAELQMGLAHTPLLIVATCRPGSHGLHELLGKSAQRLELGPLEGSLAVDLWRRWAGEGAELPSLGDAVHPLYLRELARWRAQEGHRVSDSATFDLPSLCRARVQDLPEDQGSRFAAICSAGRPVSLEVLAAVLDTPREELLRWAKEMARRDYLRISRVDDKRYLEPSHAALAAAGQELLEDEQKRDLHLRIAKQLEGAADLAAVQARAHHLVCAGSRAEASAAAVEAGRHSLDLLAFDDAARAFLSALELGGLEPDVELDVHRLAAEALDAAGRGAEAANHYLAVAAYAEGAERLNLLQFASNNLMRTGHLDDAKEVCENVLRQVGLKVRPGLRGSLAATAWSQMVLVGGGFRTRLRPGTQPDPQLLARLRALQSVGRDVGIIDPIGSAEYIFAEVRLALKIGEPHMVAERLSISALHQAVAGGGGIARGRALIARCHDILARQPDARLEQWVRGLEGTLFQYSGDSASALSILGDVESWFERNTVHEHWYLDLIRAHKLLALEQQGRYFELREEVERYAREAERCGDLAFQRGLTFYEARAHLMRDRPEEASRIARHRLGVDDLAPTRWVLLNTEGANLLYQDADDEKVKAMLQQVVAFKKEMYTRGVNLVAIQRANLEGHLRALLWQRGAQGHLRPMKACARKLARMKLPYPEALAGLLRATIAARSDNEAGALVLLRTLIPLLRRQGYSHLLAATQYRIARLDPSDTASRDEALAWARASRIRDVPAMMRTLLPGI
jgi:hypothetical protein